MKATNLPGHRQEQHKYMSLQMDSSKSLHVQHYLSADVESFCISFNQKLPCLACGTKKILYAVVAACRKWGQS